MVGREYINGYITTQTPASCIVKTHYMHYHGFLLELGKPSSTKFDVFFTLQKRGGAARTILEIFGQHKIYFLRLKVSHIKGKGRGKKMSLLDDRIVCCFLMVFVLIFGIISIHIRYHSNNPNIRIQTKMALRIVFVFKFGQIFEPE